MEVDAKHVPLNVETHAYGFMIWPALLKRNAAGQKYFDEILACKGGFADF